MRLGGGFSLLKILVVEDDVQLATTIKYLVEDNPRYTVIGIADDADGAVAAAERHQPHLALVDLHLARGSTGFSVAVRLSDFDVPCLFVSGKAPTFPMPDLALGCLMKPFTAEDVHRALALAEDKLRGRQSLRIRLPRNLQIYDSAEATTEVHGFIPSRASLWTRLGHWIAAQQRLS
jgi:DNA-binding response OmpR family regulator